MNKKPIIANIISWLLVAIFFVIGALNAFLIHPVPGIFYILLSVLYLPPINTLIQKKLNFSIPLVIKIIFGLIILWGTLAVGDLMELFEAKYL